MKKTILFIFIAMVSYNIQLISINLDEYPYSEVILNKVNGNLRYILQGSSTNKIYLDFYSYLPKLEDYLKGLKQKLSDVFGDENAEHPEIADIKNIIVLIQDIINHPEDLTNKFKNLYNYKHRYATVPNKLDAQLMKPRDKGGNDYYRLFSLIQTLSVYGVTAKSQNTEEKENKPAIPSIKQSEYSIVTVKGRLGMAPDQNFTIDVFINPNDSVAAAKSFIESEANKQKGRPDMFYVPYFMGESLENYIHNNPNDTIKTMQEKLINPREPQIHGREQPVGFTVEPFGR